MDGIFVIEHVMYVESHDDFCSDYGGEVRTILENKYFESFADAWEYVLGLIKGKERYDVDERIREVTYWNGDMYTYRVTELKPHKKG